MVVAGDGAPVAGIKIQAHTTFVVPQTIVKGGGGEIVVGVARDVGFWDIGKQAFGSRGPRVHRNHFIGENASGDRVARGASREIIGFARLDRVTETSAQHIGPGIWIAERVTVDEPGHLFILVVEKIAHAILVGGDGGRRRRTLNLSRPLIVGEKENLVVLDRCT